MAFLTPFKTAGFIDELKLEIKNNSYNWGALLYQANLHLCTPLWYVQLKKDGLLELLPEDLVEYLYYMYELSLERHEQFRDALEEILHLFNEHTIETLLLKGAATFCDDLFAPGTRVMGDLDILVPPEKVALCQELITSLGYQPIFEVELQDNQIPVDKRLHQIARHIKPGTPLVIEIHYKVSYSQAGQIFNLDDVWEHSVASEFRGCSTSIMAPQHRILLNTIHATLPLREYLIGHISILQWLEFTLLIHRYNHLIDWKLWSSVAEYHGFNNMFKLYYYFAIKYLHAPKNNDIDVSGMYLKFNEKRFILISQYKNKDNTPSFPIKVILNVFKLGYYAGLIKWLWNNQCYSEDMTGVFARMKYCVSKLSSKRSRKDYLLGE